MRILPKKQSGRNRAGNQYTPAPSELARPLYIPRFSIAALSAFITHIIVLPDHPSPKKEADGCLLVPDSAWRPCGLIAGEMRGLALGLRTAIVVVQSHASLLLALLHRQRGWQVKC